jgi:N-acyl-D-amino-acid deacylase
MAHLVREAMAAGAVGFATSTNEPHNGEGGIPMPSRLADDREMLHAGHGDGRVGARPVHADQGQRTTTIPFLEEVAADSGRPVLIAAMFHSNRRRRSGVRRPRPDGCGARARPCALAQVSPCPLTMDFTLRSPYLFESVRRGGLRWQAMAPKSGGRSMRDPAFRARCATTDEPSAGASLFNSEWHLVHVVETRSDRNRRMEGRALARLRPMTARIPFDWMFDLALAEDLDTIFTAQLLNNDPEAVGRLVADPDTHISLSTRARISPSSATPLRAAPAGPLGARSTRAARCPRRCIKPDRSPGAACSAFPIAACCAGRPPT